MIYDGITQTKIKSKLDLVQEEVQNLGFSIIPNYFTKDWVEHTRNEVLNIYKLQEESFSRESLEKINDHNIARNLVEYNNLFLELAENKFLEEIRSLLLGSLNVLSLSNAIINDPKQPSCQSRWHRDFPYQNFIADEILGLNIFITLDDFTETNGATEVLPFSNRFKNLPSNEYIKKHHLKAICPKGSIIIFDSMLLHRAGINQSNNTRIGINLNFVRPFIKQQYELLETRYNKTSPIFGSKYFSAKNQNDFRKRRLK